MKSWNGGIVLGRRSLGATSRSNDEYVGLGRIPYQKHTIQWKHMFSLVCLISLLLFVVKMMVKKITTEWKRTTSRSQSDKSKCNTRGLSNRLKLKLNVPFILSTFVLLFSYLPLGEGLDVCTWPESEMSGISSGSVGSYIVPAVGCRMSQMLDVSGDLTISGESGAFHELQSCRASPLTVNENPTLDQRHFKMNSDTSAKLTLNDLKLTFADIGTTSGADGASIYLNKGELIIKSVWFYATPSYNGQGHAKIGGALHVTDQAKKVTIEGSTFEGWVASDRGGAIHVDGKMTIKSTTFKKNSARVSLILFWKQIYTKFNAECFFLLLSTFLSLSSKS